MSEMVITGVGPGRSTFSGKESECLVSVRMDGRIQQLTWAELRKLTGMRFRNSTPEERATPLFENAGNGRGG